MAVKKEDCELNPGDTLLNFTISKLIGEGSYGKVYLAFDRNNANKRAALKIEPRMDCEIDCRLAKEAYVMSKLQGSKHIAKVFRYGHNEKYSYIFMTILGHDLEDLRRRLPNRKFSAASGLKVAIQVVQALRDLHMAGFVHRDIKPSHFAPEVRQKNRIFILGFGMVRQILIKNEENVMVLRDPRPFIRFHGIYRYCSINVHDYKELGRHDDLISALYMLCELVTGSLPWKGKPHCESAKIKRHSSEALVFKDCPPSFTHAARMLQTLTYWDEPNYNLILREFGKDLLHLHANLDEPFEWEVASKKVNE